jgi:hypothetical protein
MERKVNRNKGELIFLYYFASLQDSTGYQLQ